METSKNQQIASEIDLQLDAAVRCVNNVLTSLEADPNYNDECVKLWRIYQSLVSFHAKFQFINRLGVWFFLTNSNA